MSGTFRTTIALAAAFVAADAARAADGAHVNFVTCPIFRNGEDRCWLAEQGKTVYYIGRYGGGSAPQLLHKALIQATVSDEPSSCGGVVLKPIRISVLPEIDYSCNTILPDNGNRPSERVFYDLPAATQLLIDEPVPMPKAPFTDQQFVGQFDHDSAFLSLDLQQFVETVANYAVASNADHVKVTGHIGNSKLDDGSVLVERALLARTRAQSVAAALIGLGVKPGSMEVAWVEESAPPDGVHDADRRSVEIALTVPRTR